MSIKMTEGMRRANDVFSDLAADGVPLSLSAYTHYRLFELMAGVIDQALADGVAGAELAARASMAVVAGNGHANYRYKGDPVVLDPAPATADPVGLKAPPDDELPDLVFSDGRVAKVEIPEMPKKARGRPKGTKNKKAKKVKTEKAAEVVAENAAAEPQAGEAEA